jgi:hypothetical protein
MADVKKLSRGDIFCSHQNNPFITVKEAL